MPRVLVRYSFAIQIYIFIYGFCFVKPQKCKRETKDISINHKRAKILSTFEENCTKSIELEYTTQLLHLISKENNKSLRILKQLQSLEHDRFHFY